MIISKLITTSEGHGKLLLALPPCHTLDLQLASTFSEGEVFLVIARQGTGKVNTRECSKCY